jgi:parvulin-like peptidyl-prolyl isomerase
LLIEDVRPSDQLCTAFDPPAGGTGVLRKDGGFLAVKVLKKEEIKTPPFVKISGEIKKALIERKQKAALETWLKDLKKSATIEINRAALEKAADE